VGERRLLSNLGKVASAVVVASLPLFANALADEAITHDVPPGTTLDKYDPNLFGPDPSYQNKPYDSGAQENIYGGKHANTNPRPLLELGQPQYLEGPLDDSLTFFPFGDDNPGRPALSIFGDFRTGVAYNVNGKANQVAVWGNRLNLDADLKLTSTEHILGFFRPLDQRKDNLFSGCDLGGRNAKGCHDALNFNPQALFFEGDAASIYDGWTGDYAKRDVPFSVGLVPMFLQNGIWMDAAMVGGTITIPHLHSTDLDISNMDITFFTGLDDVTSLAILRSNGQADDNAARLFGATAFIEAMQGFFETGYGFTDDNRQPNFSYNNLAFAYTWRSWATLSESVRIIGAFGQDPGRNAKGVAITKTANGAAFLFENSFITDRPYTLVPYVNAFFGLDRPQSLTRDNGGILKNTGITFETDGLTNFPKLDDTANQTYGGAAGVEYLFDLDQQIVLEASTVQIYGPNVRPGRAITGDQYGVGLRYQIPISERVILRTDGIYAIQDRTSSIKGIRFETRVKF